MPKRTCQYCGSFLEGYTVNNVTGEFGYRGGDGGWYINETEYKNKIIIMRILEGADKPRYRRDGRINCCNQSLAQR